MATRRYAVELTRDAEKDLKKLRPWTEQATQQILKLEDNPQAGHILTGGLRDTRSLEFNLRGGGAFRAVYVVLDTDRICVVLIVGPHENIYAKAERRYRAWRKRVDMERVGSKE